MMHIPFDSQRPLYGETVIVLFADGMEIKCIWAKGKFSPVNNEIMSGAIPTHWRRIPGNARALNWKEPFATLMLSGKIETRSWYTDYRGFVLLCVSKNGYSHRQVQKMSGKRIAKRIKAHLDEMNVEVKPGHAFATGRIIDCRPMQKEDEYLCFVKYKPGLFCHIYADIKPITPFIWSGYQGWKNLSAEQLKMIQYSNK